MKCVCICDRRETYIYASGIINKLLVKRKRTPRAELLAKLNSRVSFKTNSQSSVNNSRTCHEGVKLHLFPGKFAAALSPISRFARGLLCEKVQSYKAYLNKSWASGLESKNVVIMRWYLLPSVDSALVKIYLSL